MARKHAQPRYTPALSTEALATSVAKLDPRRLARNPVIFVTAVVAALTTVILLLRLLPGGGASDTGLILQIVVWLWLTVLFANFAEAVAEGRGKAQAASLRATKAETNCKKLPAADAPRDAWSEVTSSSLRRGDVVLVEAGDIIPADGEIVEGVASVDESAITGVSAPVIRESGGDRSAVTGGTRVVSDWLVVKVTAEPGKSFLDRMIALVEGAERQKTPNEIALDILLVGFTLIFLFVVMTLEPFARFSGATIPVVFLVALFVTLIPTTIGGLLSAIGIAGMDRLVRANVIAKSGRAVEPEALGADDHHRHGAVDQRDGHVVDDLQGRSGRKEPAGLGADRLGKGQVDRRRSSRHAVDRDVALVANPAARRLDHGLDDLAGIDVVNPNLGFRPVRRHEPRLDRERPYRRQHVAAVRRGVDEPLLDLHLSEKIVDVGTFPRRGSDDSRAPSRAVSRLRPRPAARSCRR